MKSEKYKIVFCTPAIYSAGGVERVISSKANYFAEQCGYDVTIIVTEGHGGVSFFPLSSMVKVVNLSLDFEDLWGKPFFCKVYLYLKKQYKYKIALTKFLKDVHPDIVISTLRREVNFINGIHDGSVKIGELHLSRISYRGQIESTSILGKWFFYWWRKDVVKQFRKFDKFVVLTEDAVAEWPELNNVVIIPDPLTINVVRYSKLEKKRVLVIGRYSYEKGYDLLLRIWSIVEKRLNDWSLDIYGMGDPTPYVKMMTQLELDVSRCRMNTSLSDVSREFLNSSILVQPSRFESFGMVAIEAMAFGLPIVSFDCDNGPRSIITNGKNGFLVPQYNIQLFANRIIELAEDEQKRIKMGNAGKEKSEQYKIDKISMLWKNLFDELMQER